MHAYRLSGSPRTIARFLGAVIAILLLGNAVGLYFRFATDHDYVYGLIPLFNVNVERNFPSFFSVCMAMCGSALFAVIALDARNRASRDAGYWFALAAGFLYLAYDEGFQVHEKWGAPMKKLMGGSDLGFFFHGWVVPGLGVVAVVGLCFLRFTLRLPASTRRRLYTAAGLFVGGCLGMELVNGKVYEAEGNSLFYNLLVMTEEGLEMIGMATLIHALSSHIAEACDHVEFRLHAGDTLPAAGSAAAAAPIVA